jgi:hypothetical protein
MLNTGNGTAVVNGQLVNIAIKQGYDPLAFGQAYTGPDMWPRQGVYNVPPVLPSGALQGSLAPAAYGSAGNAAPMPTKASASGSPFHPTKSPLWWGLGFLVIGVLMIQHIHYSKG